VAIQQPAPQIDPAELVGEFERKLDRLKMLYEQYFMGIEKREPTVPLKEVVRIMRELDAQQIRNTGVRYRFRNLVQKFNTYKTYWHRTLRAIENGTYTRDVARLSRSLARKGITMPQLGRAASPAEVEKAMATAAREARSVKDDTDKVAAYNEDEKTPVTPLTRSKSGVLKPEVALRPVHDPAVDEDEETNPGLRGSAPKASDRIGQDTGPRLASRAARPAATPRPEPAAGSLPEAEMQSLYRRFVKAKQMCGEDTSNIKYESLVKSVNQQLPKIQAQHQGRDVEFQVVIREGRAILRAKPR
jgi:hypothetical protein